MTNEIKQESNTTELEEKDNSTNDITPEDKQEENANPIVTDTPKDNKDTSNQSTSNNTVANNNKTNNTTEKPKQNNETPKNNTTTQVTPKKEIWEELGLTKDQYFNKPTYSWQVVNYSINDYKSREATEKACRDEEDKFAKENNGGFKCESVMSPSGNYLGEMATRW